VSVDCLGPGASDESERTAGVTKPAPGGENPLQGATKRLALFEVEHARLQRAKFLEERKAKQVCVPLLWCVRAFLQSACVQL